LELPTTPDMLIIPDTYRSAPQDEIIKTKTLYVLESNKETISQLSWLAKQWNVQLTFGNPATPIPSGIIPLISPQYISNFPKLPDDTILLGHSSTSKDAWLHVPIPLRCSSLYNLLTRPEQPAIISTELLAQVYPHNIIIAEDNIVNQRVVKKMLEKLGYKNIDIVANGRELVEAYKPHWHTLILLDLQMPEVNGFEAALHLRKNGAKAWITAITANAFTEVKDQCIAAGMNDFITKPLSLSQLVASIKQITHG
jgi:CheY-like chemotaxis protein